MNDDENYYPEGIDKSEFDAMVAEEMARMEREARESMSAMAVDVDHDAAAYGGGGGDGGYYGGAAVSPEPVRRAPAVQSPSRGSIKLPYPPPVKQSPRDAKRSKQEEYALLLRLDQEEQQRSNGLSRDRERGSRGGGRRGTSGIEDDRRRVDAPIRSAPPMPVGGGGIGKPSLDVFGNAAKLSSRSPSKNVITDEQKEKIDRQREYARQLESDTQHRVQHSGHSERSERGGDPRVKGSSSGSNARRRGQQEPPPDDSNIEIYASRPGPGARAAAARDSGMSKSDKQKDYARQLEEDMYLRDRAAAERGDEETTPRKRVLSGRRQSSSSSTRGGGGDSGFAGGLAIGGESDNHIDRNAKRRQQEEYAAQLRMGNAAPTSGVPTPRDEKSRRYQAAHLEHERDRDNNTSIQLGGYDINTSQRNTNKRIHQKEYNDELTAAAHQSAVPSLGDERRNRLLADNHNNGNSLSMAGTDVSTVEMKQRKISEQRRYNRELHEAASAQPAAAPARKAFPRREAEEEHPLGYDSQGQGGGVGVFGNQQSTADARSKKRVAQEEYSNQLREDNVGSGGVGVREPNLQLGRGYSERSIGSPGEQGQGISARFNGNQSSNQGSHARDSQSIIAGRDRGYVGQDKTKYSGPLPSRQDIKKTELFQAEENMEQFRPVAVSNRVRDYKDRQLAYAQLLADDANTRDTARAGNGMEDQSTTSAQQQKRALSTGRLRSGRKEMDYAGSQGTGLMIGSMDIGTSQQKQNKKLQQQQYAQDIANANSAEPIPNSYRSVHRDQTEYMGNGLPGAANVPVRDQPNSRYHSEHDMDFGSARNSNSRQQDFQMRGTSTGGGRSQIHF